MRVSTYTAHPSRFASLVFPTGKEVDASSVYDRAIHNDADDVLKVLDFGVARLQGPAQTQTEDGVLFGTPDFMSPEVCGGERADVRSDVYSIGASLYFMLTGTALFPDRSMTEVIMMHISRTPDLPSSRARGIPADLEAVVMKCLAKEPHARFQGRRRSRRSACRV
jgi:serine/threonine-protein kinase